MINTNTINYHMRAVRIALNISQEELAVMIDKSIAYISLWERGLINNESVTNDISQALDTIKQRGISENGEWYGAYIDTLSSMIEIDVYKRLTGSVPDAVVKLSKIHCIRWSNGEDIDG